MQRALIHQKHNLTIDGLFGSGTESAVKAYQSLRGLTADGVVGDATWTSLFLTTPMAGSGLQFGSGGGSQSIFRLNDSCSEVRQIKRRMAAESLFNGTINNLFDATLELAVKNFQSSKGTTIDGKVGPVTWSLLFPIVKKQTGQQDGAKAVQTLLNLNGYSVGTPDGLFGTGSETKLIAFQQAKGLTADGICGASTWAKLCLI